MKWIIWIVGAVSAVIGALFGISILRQKKSSQDQSSNEADSNFAQDLQDPGPFEPPAPIVKEILDKMFTEYEIVPTSDQNRGFSQSGVYQVRYRNKSKEFLPAAVKIAPAYLIEREREAYSKHIEDRLPNAAELRQFAYSNSKKWAGLHYKWAGEGVQEMKSLYDYLRSDEVTPRVMEKTLNNLFQAMAMFWQKPVLPQDLPVKDSFDRVLPVNLVIDPVIKAHISSRNIDHLSPQTIDKYRFKLPLMGGISLQGFQVVEIDPYEIETKAIKYTLNLPTSDNYPNPLSFRVRLNPERSSKGKLAFGQEPTPTTGLIRSTRSTLLQNYAWEILKEQNAHLYPTEGILRLNWLGDKIKLPNPLLAIEKILESSISVRVATIHGDLHLGNILVGLENRNMKFIDFADAREDYVLHDLFRLETSIVTRWLAQVFQENSLPAWAIFPFYRQLDWTTTQDKSVPYKKLHPALRKPIAALRKIRRVALEYQINGADYGEYYNGLTLYLLGALKFGEIDRFGHQVAFCGAATNQYLLSPGHSKECNDSFAAMISPNPSASENGRNGSSRSSTLM